MPARAPALPGWPHARARFGPCERLLPLPASVWERGRGRGNLKGTAGRDARGPSGCPARARSGPCERLLPSPASKGGAGLGVGGNYKGTAGRDARGPKLGPPSQRRGDGGVGGFTGGVTASYNGTGSTLPETATRRRWRRGRWSPGCGPAPSSWALRSRHIYRTGSPPGRRRRDPGHPC